jgi:hypothetical protein
MFTLEVQLRNFVSETLPLGLLALGIVLGVCIVGAVDQSEINSCLDRISGSLCLLILNAVHS